MQAIAVVLEAPERLGLSALTLDPPRDDDVTVRIDFSGISTGTERLLWSGRMPHFPGMGYPLVPGYESVGTVVEAGNASGLTVGDHVFVPGANCFGPVRGLFGGAASHLVVPASRAVLIDPMLGERGVLLALAATAHHAVAGALPDLIVGHGVLGRLAARLAVIGGATPVIWETEPARHTQCDAYSVLHPDADGRRDYRHILDVSGDPGILDTLMSRSARGAEIVLGGFYAERLHFGFPPAFMRETRLRVAAEWTPGDLAAVNALIAHGQLSLDGLITHRSSAGAAESAYRTAFGDKTCLKMILDWSNVA